jgi:hypothetical protein
MIAPCGLAQMDDRAVTNQGLALLILADKGEQVGLYLDPHGKV